MKTTLRHTNNYRGSVKPIGMQNAIWFTGADCEKEHCLR